MSTDRIPEVLQAARLYLVSKCPYVAHAAYAIHPVYKAGLPTLACDKWWRMYWGDAVLEWPVEKLASGMAHEIVGHLLRGHHDRLEYLPPQIGNICGDLEYNDEPILPIDLGWGWLHPKLFNLPEGLLAEEYADKLPKQGGKGKGQGQQGEPGLGNGDCGSCADGKQREHEESGPAQGDGQDGQGQTPGVSGQEADVIRHQVAADIQREQAQGRGNIPAGMVRWAEKVLHKPRDWKAELRGAIRGEVIRASGHAEYTYTRPGRRAGALAPIIPPAMVRTVPRIAVVMDTSGSMGDRDIGVACVEVGAVIAAVSGQVAVIACDAAAERPQWVQARPDSIKLAGGGGTDMGVGIAAALAMKPQPTTIFVFTDGETPWPDKPRVPVIVGIVRTDLTGPAWAKTVQIGKDK